MYTVGIENRKRNPSGLQQNFGVNVSQSNSTQNPEKVGIGILPFVLAHVAVLAGIWIHPTWETVGVGIALYFLRMFGITAGYHRYFSHRTYKTGRVFQFILAFLGTASAQKGVLWWAGHHRNHHKFSDQPEDLHSPLQRGFWWSHMVWFLVPRYDETPFDKIKDFAKYPELRWLNRHFMVPPVVVGFAVWAIWGWPGLIWGFLASTVALWHGTFTINSLSHVFGKQRYRTTDTSRNNVWLALLTMGEGWHNNHHYFQSSVRQGFFWWEIDASYYVLKVLSWFGVVWDLKMPPEQVLHKNLVEHGDPVPALAPRSLAQSWREQLEAAKARFDAAHTEAARKVEAARVEALARIHDAASRAEAAKEECSRRVGKARRDARLRYEQAKRDMADAMAKYIPDGGIEPEAG